MCISKVLKHIIHIISPQGNKHPNFTSNRELSNLPNLIRLLR